MASSSQKSAFASEVFQIVVGAEEKVFYAHVSLLSKSEVLRKEVEGFWKENKERKIVWAHWNPIAAENFVEWLYTEDCTGAYPSPILDAEQTSAKDEKDLSIKDTRTSTDPVSSASPQQLPWKPYMSKLFDNLTSQDPDPEAEKPHVLPLTRVQELIGPKGNRKSEKMSKAEEYDKWTGHMLWRPNELDYDKTLMIHAELYMMSSQYMLDELKDLTWQRLRSVLVSIGTPVRGSPYIRNLVKVLRYAYKESGTDSLGDDEEPLRKLVSTFIAQHFTRLKGPEIDEIFASAKDLD
ncbi:MAG: hypothetical protein Q9228_001703 [Teloschistes exilis]